MKKRRKEKKNSIRIYFLLICGLFIQIYRCKKGTKKNMLI